MHKKVSIAWLVAAGILLVSMVAAPFAFDLGDWVSEGIVNPIRLYSALTLIVSAIAFVQFGWDKRQAKHNGWRVPEKTLLLSALICGWPGAVLGQHFFRHKTQKQPFANILIGISVVHVLIPVAFVIAIAFGVV